MCDRENWETEILDDSRNVNSSSCFVAQVVGPSQVIASSSITLGHLIENGLSAPTDG